MLLLCSTIAIVYSCGNNSEKTGTHTHSDGSTHSDHDTVKPRQQEFNVQDTGKKDSSTHTHKDGVKHSH
jgi:hypothetical protein